MLIRFPSDARSRRAKAILQVVTERGDDLLKLFVVVTPAGARTSRLPTDDGT